MKIHFPVTEMTFWRYFIPVALEAKRRGHEPVFSLKANSKYNNPCSISNKNICNNLMSEFGFKFENSGDITICVEGIGAEASPVSYALTYMYDFSGLYKGYINKVNHVVLPSEYFAKFFDCISDKNLYLGCPKYDVVIERSDVYDKYKLSSDNKYALVVYPRARDLSRIDITKICEDLEHEGYTPLLKTRGKDPIRSEHMMYTNFADESWYPHTSMELLTICDRVVNTGSSLIKEAAMMGMQGMVKNYNVKPAHCNDMPILYSENARDYLGPKGSTSKRILNHLEKTYG